MSPSSPYAHDHAHDFKPPGGLLHIKATIFWNVLPEIVIFSAFAFLITSLSETIHQLEIAPTMLVVFGTLTFKTNSAFASYSEGRRLWSAVILASRSFGRIAWLHVPDYLKVPKEGEAASEEERQEALAEKKTYINLVAAFSIALKHYVRGEPGIHYVDLYPLVSFLPRYRLPTSNYLRRPDLDPSFASTGIEPDAIEMLGASAWAVLGGPGAGKGAESPLSMSRQASYDPAFAYHGGAAAGSSSLHLSATDSRTPILASHRLDASTSTSASGSSSVGSATLPPLTPAFSTASTSASTAGAASLRHAHQHARSHSSTAAGAAVDLADVAAKLRDRKGEGLGEVKRRRSAAALAAAAERAGNARGAKHELLPARNPPPRSIDDYVPFYDFFADLVYTLLRRGKRVADKIEDSVQRGSSGGRRRGRAKREKGKKQPLLTRETYDNVPLEIVLLLSGWVAALQRRKTIDVPTINSLLAALQSLTDALTGLERVLLTPIPVAYSLHLRHVIWLYLLLLPSQTHETLGWLAVPATALATFVFLGLLRLGDQIENPLGYDPSDLDLESFALTVLRELREVVSHAADEASPEVVLALAREAAAAAAAGAATSARESMDEGEDGALVDDKGKQTERVQRV
ncbi:uncharacterized protein JCM10292_002854 [Rhodotorula paludigena]|uniref:uncharacterized protein n=1 Tax=Rhodotorula paludigena TaxID=86838 RepID=UPI0031722CE7